jgi:hypothetical protein
MAVRGVIRLVGGVRGWGRGEIDGDGVAGMRRLRNHAGRKKFAHRKARFTKRVPRSAGAVVIANNLDSHIFRGE